MVYLLVVFCLFPNVLCSLCFQFCLFSSTLHTTDLISRTIVNIFFLFSLFLSPTSPRQERLLSLFCPKNIDQRILSSDVSFSPNKLLLDLLGLGYFRKSTSVDACFPLGIFCILLYL